MKCYFAVTAPDSEKNVYVSLLEVALKSARLNTTLDLYVLYDGPREHKCYQILKEYNVNIIEHKFSHTAEIAKLFTTDFVGRPLKVNQITCTFMRLDVPFIEQEDEYVLYSDFDVVFTKDINVEELPKPKYLAASSEFTMERKMAEYFNAGVMVFNVKNMREKCKLIFKDLEEGKVINGFDQGYLNEHCKEDYEWLDIKFNWKPYWGINHDASIVHYHGMKPGSEVAESGYGMTDDVLAYTMTSEKSMAGYAYYYMLYFHLSASSEAFWTNWLSNFLAHAYELSMTRLLQNAEQQKEKELQQKEKEFLQEKYKRKIRLYRVLNICSLGLSIYHNRKKLKKLKKKVESM